MRPTTIPEASVDKSTTAAPVHTPTPLAATAAGAVAPAAGAVAPAANRALRATIPASVPSIPDLPALPTPRRLAADAADLLRDHILAGGLVRGTHLVEAKLAGQLNVSRGTVREAFRVLAAEGLIVEGVRRGAFVVSLSDADVREIYDVRAAVEGRAA